jgi:hypothetical protein
VPETNRSWSLRGEPVPLNPNDLIRYRGLIEAFKRRQLNTGEADGRKLCTELESFLREAYEGRSKANTYVGQVTSGLSHSHSAKWTLIFGEVDS